jgi:polyphosphate glucokinase
MKVLVVDVGGTHVKILASGHAEPRRVASWPAMSAAQMVDAVRTLASGWDYEAVAIGYPGPVRHGAPSGEPPNLGPGWVGFDYAGAFGRPVKIVNDAAMQALGSYEGGTMLFLGLGTGLGTTLIVDGVVVPMELGHLPYKHSSFEDHVGEQALQRHGKKKWRQHVFHVVAMLSAALLPDEVVLGGGNVRALKALPPRCRAGSNDNAFAGGLRLWRRTAGTSKRGETSECARPGPSALR